MFGDEILFYALQKYWLTYPGEARHQSQSQQYNEGLWHNSQTSSQKWPKVFTPISWTLWGYMEIKQTRIKSFLSTHPIPDTALIYHSSASIAWIKCCGEHFLFIWELPPPIETAHESVTSPCHIARDRSFCKHILHATSSTTLLHPELWSNFSLLFPMLSLMMIIINTSLSSIFL